MLLPLQRGDGALGVEAEQQVEQRLHAQAARRRLLQEQPFQPLQPILSRHAAAGLCRSLWDALRRPPPPLSPGVSAAEAPFPAGGPSSAC